MAKPIDWQRKKQIMCFVASGMQIKDIAETLSVTPRQIHLHIVWLMERGYLERVGYQITDKGRKLSKST